MDDFELIKRYLEKTLDIPTFNKWIAPLSYIGTKNNIAFIGSPDRKKTVWIKTHILDNINTHAKKEFNLTLKLVPLYNEDDLEDPSLDTDPVAEPIPGQDSNHEPDPSLQQLPFHSNLHPKYNFENFVQVDQNRMAYSFAYSVSEFPGKSYNPLYIYSDVGLGKTHLLYAIGNRIVQINPKMNVIYSTTSEFMHEYVEFNRLNKRPDFIKKYTSVDVLLIDDIQYITKWGGTSEQFYYIFNKLIQMQKQIVLCSDKHPDNIPDLEHRIKSRFEWGGIVDILPYELDGRLAILKNKLFDKRDMLKNSFAIPEEVLYFMADAIKDNVRKLEGALNRLIGVANLKYTESSGTQITLEFAREALKPILPLPTKATTIESIREYVAKKYRISVDDLVSKSNKREIAEPRQIAMYMSKLLTKTPLHEIGTMFGGKHHTTVLHSLKKVEHKMEAEPEFSREIDSIVRYFSTN